MSAIHYDERNPPDLSFSPAIRFASEFNAHAQDWLWPARIPRARLTLLIGDPGVGKSLLTLDVAARVSANQPWPDDPCATAVSAVQQPGNAPAASEQAKIQNPKSKISAGDAPPDIKFEPHYGGVLLASAEDTPDEALIPRLTAAGADLARICTLAGVVRPARSQIVSRLTLPTHARVLAEAVRAIHSPRLVILDPLTSFIESAAQTGGRGLNVVFDALAEIASAYHVAIVGVGHLNKARSHRLLYRARGSLAFVAAARSVLLLSHDPADPQRRILSSIKNVYGPPPPPLAFHLAPGPRLDWTAAPDLPTDLLDLSDDSGHALLDACDWLARALAAGPVPAAEVLRSARRHAISETTLRRAKRTLSVRFLKPSAESQWLWSLPECPDNRSVQIAVSNA